MRRVVLTFAALVTVGLATGTAWARHGYSGYGPGNYRSYNSSYSSWDYGGVNSHAAAVRRIMAAHSRYRFNPHPRSMYNAPPRGVKYYPGGYGIYGW